MGINLTASCKYQSHNWDWEWSKAGAEKVSLGLSPAVWRQRKQKSVPADKMEARLVLTFDMLWSTKKKEGRGVRRNKRDLLPLVASSTSELHSSSTDVVVFGLGAGCTQVGIWLVLGKSSTRLRGSSPSSLYVQANWERMTLSLTWEKKKKKLKSG